jgi:hypothetical protein
MLRYPFPFFPSRYLSLHLRDSEYLLVIMYVRLVDIDSISLCLINAALPDMIDNEASCTNGDTCM